MLGLRVSEACNTQISDLRYSGGYELLQVIGKGNEPAEIPLPMYGHPSLSAWGDAPFGA